MHEHKKQILELEKVPMQIDAWSLPLNDRTWRHDGYFHLFKESLYNISDNLMSCMHPRGNENNRHRESILLKSGAMKISTIQCEH